MTIDYNRLNAFLHLCYLPDLSVEYIQHIIHNTDEFRKQKQWMRNKSHEDLVKEGVLLLRNIFKELADKHHDKKYVIPLSGGLDSRAILAHLIALGFKENLVTVTYGIPGTYDFNIGKEVARFTGVKNIAFDLNKVKITKDNLVYTCETNGSWTALTPSYYNRLCVKNFGEDCCFWSGLLAGEIAGNHYWPGYENLNWKDAIKAFWDYNKWEKRGSTNLVNKGFEFQSVLPDKPLIEDPSLVSYPEQLDFCIRQTSWIKKAIVDIAPTVEAPFSHPDWVSYMLAIPFESRDNCSLYRSILIKAFPDYYSLPTKNLNGNPLIGKVIPNKTFLSRAFSSKFKLNRYRNINKGLNYIDYNDSYRYRTDLINLVEESIQNMQAHKIAPWIDAKTIWDNHKSGRQNIWQTIELLISMQISYEYNDVAVRNNEH